METKYGKISSSSSAKYRKSIIDKIWLLIPLKEEGCTTLQSYIERTNRELYGMMKCIVGHDEYIITVMCLLENLITEENFENYRHDVLRCCELVSKAISGTDVSAPGGDSNV